MFVVCVCESGDGDFIGCRFGLQQTKQSRSVALVVGRRTWSSCGKLLWLQMLFDNDGDDDDDDGCGFVVIIVVFCCDTVVIGSGGGP